MCVDRGVTIDSMFKVIANCDSAIELTFRAMERERESIANCENMRRTMVDMNVALADELKRSRINLRIASGGVVFLSGAIVTVLLVK